MNRKGYKICLVALLIFSILILPVAADTSFTFTVPGSSADSDKQSELADKVQNMIDTIQSSYYKDVKTEDLINGAMKGMFETLDPHSEYFTKEEYDEFSKSLDGKLTGVGVQIESKDGYITVVAPISGTPADKAGMKAGDHIISVDGVSIIDYTPSKAANLIRGEAGTKVRLGVKRDGVNDTIFYDLVRAVINVNPVEYEIKPNNIGYLKLTEFSANSYENTKKALDFFKSKNVKGIIIDVRNNPGGLLSQVDQILKQIIPSGPIYHIQKKGTPRETHYSTLDKAPFKIVVLVNGGSASASEILSGAVKDSKVGILVGEKTYGKGTVQTVWDGDDGTGYKITIANYLTPSGFSLDGIGLQPNVEVKSNVNEYLKSITPVSGTKSLKYNTVSLDVLGVQQRLEKLGYNITDQDGFFSNSTKAAVLKFQKDYKLKQDATMDADDIKTLQYKFEDKLKAQDPQLDRAIVEITKMLKQ